MIGGLIGSQTEALAIGSEPGGTSPTATVEAWNGSAWSELADLASPRGAFAGYNGGGAAGLVAGGSSPGVSSTEEWTAAQAVKTITTS